MDLLFDSMKILEGLGFRAGNPRSKTRLDAVPLTLQVRTLNLNLVCRPVINQLTPFKGLNVRIPIIIPIKGKGLLITGLH